MKTIWKYALDPSYNASIFEIEMPSDSIFLDLQLQPSPESITKTEPFIWVQVDTDKPKRKYLFYIIGTGQEIPDKPLNYIGTFQEHMFDNLFVFHLYVEEIEKDQEEIYD